MNRWGVREHFVYWMFDTNGDCLYVGMTRRPEARWRRHQSDRPEMASRVAYRRMAGPYLIQDARRIEKEQQLELLPKYDRTPAVARRRRSKQPTRLTVAPSGGNYHPGIPHLHWRGFTAIPLGDGRWQMHHRGEPTIVLAETDPDFQSTEWEEVPA